MTYVNTVLILISIAFNWRAIRSAKFVANILRTETYIRDPAN